MVAVAVEATKGRGVAAKTFARHVCRGKSARHSDPARHTQPGGARQRGDFTSFRAVFFPTTAFFLFPLQIYFLSPPQLTKRRR